MKLGEPWTREVVPGVFRLGTTYVGCYAIEDGGAYTFVDTGLPGYWDQLVGFLAARGAPVSAVQAVVLTHHHADHRGTAERLRREAGATVHVHQKDRALTTGAAKPPAFPLWQPRVVQYVFHCLRRGAARTPPVTEAAPFVDEVVLDVPGRPRVIQTPGHTPGSAVLSLEDRGVLLVGDALVTLDLVSGASGPRLLPRFANGDHELALASLRQLEAVQARWVLPGHGDPWEGSPAEAVKLAREIAGSKA